MWDDRNVPFVNGLFAHVYAAGCHATMEDAAEVHCPSDYEDEQKSPDKDLWDESMTEELNSLIERGTFDTVPLSSLPPNVKPIPCKWIYKVKPGADGKVLRRKSHVVAQGFCMQYGRHYTHIYSPVAFAVTIRLFLAICAAKKLRLRALDVKTAFLYGDLPAN